MKVMFAFLLAENYDIEMLLFGLSPRTKRAIVSTVLDLLRLELYLHGAKTLVEQSHVLGVSQISILLQ